MLKRSYSRGSATVCDQCKNKLCTLQWHVWLQSSCAIRHIICYCPSSFAVSIRLMKSTARCPKGHSIGCSCKCFSSCIQLMAGRHEVAVAVSRQYGSIAISCVLCCRLLVPINFQLQRRRSIKTALGLWPLQLHISVHPRGHPPAGI